MSPAQKRVLRRLRNGPVPLDSVDSKTHGALCVKGWAAVKVQQHGVHSGFDARIGDDAPMLVITEDGRAAL